MKQSLLLFSATRKLNFSGLSLGLLFSVLVSCPFSFASDSDPYCYLSGYFSRRQGTSGETPPGMVRMQYQADTAENCISISKEVCRTHKDEGLIPENLVVTFRQHTSDYKSTRYGISKDCTSSKKLD